MRCSHLIAPGTMLNGFRLAIVLALGLFLAPGLADEAQQVRPVHRIGFLRNGPPPQDLYR